MRECGAVQPDGGYVRLAHLDRARCVRGRRHVVSCTLEAGHDGSHADLTHNAQAFGPAIRWQDGEPIPNFALMALAPAASADR